jgi:Ni/Co efflux regulator RcnB
MIRPMRRLPALAAALAVVAGPLLAAGGQVWAKDHGQHSEQRGESRGEGRGEGRWNGERGAPPGWRGGGGPPGWRGGAEPPGWSRREEARGEYRGHPRGDPRGDPRYGYEGRAYAPPPQAYGTPRRGGYLGPQGGAPIENPGRYRLREAPRGYTWMRVPGGMALVSQATGQVFDVVPDR